MIARHRIFHITPNGKECIAPLGPGGTCNAVSQLSGCDAGGYEALQNGRVIELDIPRAQMGR